MSKLRPGAGHTYTTSMFGTLATSDPLRCIDTPLRLDHWTKSISKTGSAVQPLGTISAMPPSGCTSDTTP